MSSPIHNKREEMVKKIDNKFFSKIKKEVEDRRNTTRESFSVVKKSIAVSKKARVYVDKLWKKANKKLKTDGEEPIHYEDMEESFVKMFLFASALANNRRDKEEQKVQGSDLQAAKEIILLAGIKIHPALQNIKLDANKTKQKFKKKNGYNLFLADLSQKKKEKGEKVEVKNGKLPKEASKAWAKLSEKQKAEWKKKARVMNVEAAAKVGIDLNKPKKKNKTTGYIMFSGKVRPKIQKDFPKIKQNEVMKKIGKSWKKLDDEAKAKWNKQAETYNEDLQKENEEKIQSRRSIEIKRNIKAKKEGKKGKKEDEKEKEVEEIIESTEDLSD
jgi:hypothetical protein